MAHRTLSLLLTLSATLFSSTLSADRYSEVVWQQLQAHERSASEADFVNRHFILGKLRAGAYEEWTVELERGRRYLLTGACDQDCSDVDLALIDRDGRLVSEDVLEDDQPVLDIMADGWRVDSGSYTLRMTMYRCEVEPCYYGIGVFEQVGRGI